MLECADVITNICRLGTEKSAANVTKALSGIVDKVVHKADDEESLSCIGYFLNSIPWLAQQDNDEKVEKFTRALAKKAKDNYAADAAHEEAAY